MNISNHIFRLVSPVGLTCLYAMPELYFASRLQLKLIGWCSISNTWSTHWTRLQPLLNTHWFLFFVSFHYSIIILENMVEFLYGWFYSCIIFCISSTVQQIFEAPYCSNKQEWSSVKMIMWLVIFKSSMSGCVQLCFVNRYIHFLIWNYNLSHLYF